MTGLSVSRLVLTSDNDPMDGLECGGDRGGAMSLALRAGVLFSVIAGTLAACSPTLDWRQARPEGSGVTMLFPCRPAHVERSVRVGSDTLVMHLHSCSAGGATFSLAVADAGQADRVAPLLTALRELAVVNIGGIVSAAASAPSARTTPDARAGRVRIDGRLPDGRVVVEHAAFFSRGVTLLQATILAIDRPVTAETVGTFFDAVRTQ
ncbi:MAG: hypothetical protein ABI281_08365 [Caldimonas sp.]